MSAEPAMLATESTKEEKKDDTAIAWVSGTPFIAMPKDLYIPPEALEIFLDTFQGPLDLLLYLIKKQNVNILDIPIAEITRQYMVYVELMKITRLELAADYLVMAAMLAEIKSRLLLPKPSSLSAEEPDPRAELVRKLEAYEQLKQATDILDKLPQLERDIFAASVPVTDSEMPRPKPAVDIKELFQAFLDVMQRVSHQATHAISRENLSVRERMSGILSRVNAQNYTDFHALFSLKEGKPGVVVTFIAILELLKQALIDIVQQEPFTPIYVKAATV